MSNAVAVVIARLIGRKKARNEMIKAEIFEILRQQLRDVFAPYGFQFREDEVRSHEVPNEGDFVRTSGDITQTIGMPLAVYARTFDWSLVFGIRIEAVSEIFARFASVEPKYRPEIDTCTFNSEAVAANLSGEDVRHDVHAIQQSVAQLTPIIVRDVMPLLDAHRNLASIDDLMNGSGSCFDTSLSSVAVMLAKSSRCRPPTQARLTGRR